MIDFCNRIKNSSRAKTAMPHDSVLFFWLFLVQKCTKKGSNPNFFELWDLVLMSLMILEKIKKFPPKMWPKT